MKSIKSRKQRKKYFNAPLHKKRKWMSSHLEENLLLKYDLRRIPVVKGDTVKVMRGNFKGHEDKVSHVNVSRRQVEVEGLVMTKADGKKIAKPIHASNLLITKLNLTDKWRRENLERDLSDDIKQDIEKEAKEQIIEAEEEKRKIEEIEKEKEEKQIKETQKSEIKEEEIKDKKDLQKVEFVQNVDRVRKIEEESNLKTTDNEKQNKKESKDKKVEKSKNKKIKNEKINKDKKKRSTPKTKKKEESK
jgi:large subunit ribosomal protein L24